MSDVMPFMTCCVCGAYCSGRQWWNRDNGYGLCTECPAWLRTRGVSEAEMENLYGKEGVHYNVPTETTEAQ